ncbi:hypothetical protein [Pseudomonas phage LUZ7]|uniref:Uncharacterized protein n=1 Tax=Pseudomonas phage LUZ7 TaxID=655097 RepID=C8ZKK1_9CAUD|nr:hypothetical protein PP-LUZ7_gp102 [Pseudomonas phage LUZ7]CAZ66243.1 hypothetical protein [Pseudomonas phage LUZ7]
MKPELEDEFLRHTFNRILYRKAWKEDLPGAMCMYQDLGATFTKLSNQGVTREDFELGWARIGRVV